MAREKKTMTILPLFMGNDQYEVMSSEVTENRMYIKISFHMKRYEVVPGDWVEFGIIISNSEVGLGAVIIRPFLNRLICTNGCVVNDFGERRHHVGRQAKAVEDSFYKAQLYHTSANVEMRKMESRTQCLSHGFIYFSEVFMTTIFRSLCSFLSFYFPFLRIYPILSISHRHHQTISASVSLFFYEVHFVLDFIRIVNKYFLAPHSSRIIAAHLLETEEEVMKLVMDTFMIYMERRVITVNLVCVYDNSACRNFCLSRIFSFSQDAGYHLHQFHIDPRRQSAHPP